MTAKNLARELRGSRKRFRELIDAAPQAIFLLDADGALVEVNSRACVSLGYERGELLDLSVGNFIVQGRQTVADWVSRIVPEVSLLGNGVQRRKDGTKVIVEFQARLVVLGGRRRILLITDEIQDYDDARLGTVDPSVALELMMRGEDPTTARPAKRPTRVPKAVSDEVRLRQVIDLVPHMIFALDRTGRFLLVNRATAEAYGTTVEELTGTRLADVVAGGIGISPMLAQDWESAQTDAPNLTPEESYVDVLGRHGFLQTIKIPYTASGTSDGAVLCVALDITNLKEVEEELRKHQEHLEDLVRDRTRKLNETNRHLRSAITQRKRVEVQMTVYQSQLRRLASQMLLTEEKERRRLASDLHDGLGQKLALVKMQLDSLRSMGEPGAEVALADVINVIDQTHKSVRSLTFELSPPILHDLGLAAAVEWLAEDMSKRTGVQIAVKADAQARPMNEQSRIIAYRCVRELLMNVIKHAHATDATVSIEANGRQLRIGVRDNGIGFASEDVNETLERNAFGLFSVRERVEHVGGAMKIRSTPGKGAVVTLDIPPIAAPRRSAEKGPS